MYFLCFLLLLIIIRLNRELCIINNLCLILHVLLHFVRLDYFSLEFLDLLSEDLLFLNLLVTKLHLKTCDSTFMRHMILNDGLFHRVIWNVGLQQNTWRGMCLRKLSSCRSVIMVAWTYIASVILVRGIHIAGGCAHGWMPKSWQTTMLAQLPCTDHTWSLNWTFAGDFNRIICLVFPVHLFFIIFKVHFVLGEWLHSGCWVRIV